MRLSWLKQNQDSPRRNNSSSPRKNILTCRKIDIHKPGDMDTSLTDLYKERLYQLREMRNDYHRKVNQKPSIAVGTSPVFSNYPHIVDTSLPSS